MKKIIVMLLCLSTLFACVGCNNEKETKTEIVGEWMAPSVNAAATFNADGTGVLEYNGKQNVTWKYDSDRKCYVISGKETHDATVGKEYDMQYISLMGIDFYTMDDYDKAYTLMLSKRLEDISMFTENMNKIEIGKQYDLLNGVTVEFTEVTRHSSDKGLTVSYIVTNHRNEPVSEGLKSTAKGKGYFADSPSATDLSKDFQWAESLDAGEAYEDILVLMHHEYILGTINRYGLVIGAICFEFAGQNYFFDLSDWLK